MMNVMGSKVHNEEEATKFALARQDSRHSGFGSANIFSKFDSKGGFYDRFYDLEGNYITQGGDGKTDYIRVVGKRAIAKARAHSQKTYGTQWFEDIATSPKQALAYILGFATLINKTELSPQAISKIYTPIIAAMPEVDIKLLHNGELSVSTGTNISSKSTDYKLKPGGYNDPSPGQGVANTDRKKDTATWLPNNKGYRGDETGVIKVTIVTKRGIVNADLNTVSGAQNTLGIHEFLGHGVKGFGFNDKTSYDPNGTHYKAYDLQRKHSTWKKVPASFRKDYLERAKKYEVQRKR
ncbi:hypothetical protein M23134_00134 [Microscilla marina ATCC 23134]|uniref:Uncharacterized protein n=2 Tax=Microscilla marina TaxID=1027 RepID=A1ZL14_MICM2|nr:hypothetical protein M23134_00134 [Microscilla marina ATCC 23134]